MTSSPPNWTFSQSFQVSITCNPWQPSGFSIFHRHTLPSMHLRTLCSSYCTSHQLWFSFRSAPTFAISQIYWFLHQSTSSPTPDILFRCSQASTAFKQLEPFLRRPLISQRQKLQTYAQIVQSVLLHGMEAQTFSPAQVAKIDSLHFKALRRTPDLPNKKSILSQGPTTFRNRLF